MLFPGRAQGYDDEADAAGEADAAAGTGPATGIPLA
jgi:hypothetical protein